MRNRANYIIYFSVVALYYIGGLFVAFSPSLHYIPKNIRVIFALFFFAFGTYRLTRFLNRKRDHDY